MNRFNLVYLLSKPILGKEKRTLGFGTEVGEGRKVLSIPLLSPPPTGAGSLIKLMLLLVLLDDCLVRFLEVLCQNNVAVLTYGQHSTLLRDES